MTTKKGTLQVVAIENYEGEKESWTNFLGELEDACQRGLMDDILRPVAKAIFDRRDVLQGKPPGTSFRGPNNPPPADETNKSDQVSVEVLFTGKIQPLSGDSEGTVEIGGKHYARTDIIGKNIRLPKTVKPSSVAVHRVRIIGVGPKKVMVKWIDAPPHHSTLRAAYDKDPKQPAFLTHSALDDILG